MDWYYNSFSGAVIQMPSWDPRRLIPGWHGPFVSQDDAVKYYQDNKPSNHLWGAPVDYLGMPLTIPPIVKSAVELPGKVVTSVVETAAKNTIKTIFGEWHLDRLLLQATEIILGTVLIAVGISKLTGTTNFIVNTVGSVVKTGVKTAAIVK